MLARLGSADWSLPVWEEWIEMHFWPFWAVIPSSLPVWEEWIEINNARPVGVSRLVSSRMGRVD